MKNVALKLKPEPNKMKLNNLKAFFATAVEHNLPVALWHLPEDKNSYAITSFKGVQKEIIDFEKLSGFIVSPFNSESDETNYISNDLIMDDSGFYKENAEIDKDNLKQFLGKYQANLSNQKINWFNNKDNDYINYSKETYIDLIKKSIDYIKLGEIKKIVTSRTKVIDLKKDFNPINLFEKLSKKYHYAFISLISIPNIGTWIGASPEILLKIEKDNLNTMSLASTQIYKGQAIEDVEWGLKEKEEQLTVTEYIEEKFINSKVKNYDKSIAKTIIAGNVLHIQTMFNYSSENINKFATEFIKDFSPTPAVCGYPKDKAMKFLLENELHQRNFYSGFIGTINLFNQSNLFVNLRCMQLKEDKAIMYIGGGITADSIPEKEWYETELKSQTLLSVINE